MMARKIFTLMLQRLVRTLLHFLYHESIKTSLINTNIFTISNYTFAVRW